APFVANTATYLGSLVSLLLVKTPFHTERERKPLHLRAEVMEGLKWMWGNPLIRYMAILTGGLNFINAATPLMVIVLAKHLGADDAMIGSVFSAMGVGGVVGSLVGGKLARRFTFGQAIIGVIWIEAILFPLYVLAPSFPILALVAGAYYFLGPTYNVVQFSYRVAIIPDHLQGRVNSVFRLLAFGFMPAGAAVSGVLLERLGVVPAVLLLSAWIVAFALATTFNRHVREAAPL
ncbi:MAG TPA: MFS transporter, partial [Usitatibacter sp.]|nr:MFS transporter [Usitatibacter sp.]